MNGKITLIKVHETPNSTVVMQQVKPDAEFIYTNRIPELAEMQKMVGGYLERVPRFNKYENKKAIVFCDEEGKLKEKPINLMATFFWYEQVQTADVLVGDIIILTGDDEFMASI